MDQASVILGYVIAYCLSAWATVFIVGTLGSLFLGWRGGEGSIGVLLFAPVLPFIWLYSQLSKIYYGRKHRAEVQKITSASKV